MYAAPVGDLRRDHNKLLNQRSAFLNWRSRFNTGQLLIQSLELEGEFVVIDSMHLSNGCIEVVDVHGSFSDVVTEIVRFPDRNSTAYATPPSTWKNSEDDGRDHSSRASIRPDNRRYAQTRHPKRLR